MDSGGRRIAIYQGNGLPGRSRERCQGEGREFESRRPLHGNPASAGFSSFSRSAAGLTLPILPIRCPPAGWTSTRRLGRCSWPRLGRYCRGICLIATTGSETRRRQGSIRQRSAGSFELRVFVGVDPQTRSKRYRSMTFRGNRRSRTGVDRDHRGGRIGTPGRCPLTGQRTVGGMVRCGCAGLVTHNAPSDQISAQPIPVTRPRRHPCQRCHGDPDQRAVRRVGEDGQYDGRAAGGRDACSGACGVALRVLARHAGWLGVGQPGRTCASDHGRTGRDAATDTRRAPSADRTDRGT